jgi:hypothetical protein
MGLDALMIAASLVLGAGDDSAAPCDALAATCPLDSPPYRFRVGPTRFEFLFRGWQDDASLGCSRSQTWLVSPTLGLLRFRERESCCQYNCDTVPHESLVSVRTKDAATLVIVMKRTGWEPDDSGEGTAERIDEEWSETIGLADFSRPESPRSSVELPRLRRLDPPEAAWVMCPAIDLVGFSPDGRLAYVEHRPGRPDGPSWEDPQLVVLDLVRDRELARRRWQEGKTTVGYGVRAPDLASSPPSWWGELRAIERRAAWDDPYEVRIDLVLGERGERPLAPGEGEHCSHGSCYRLLAEGGKLILQRDGSGRGRKVLATLPALTKPPVRMTWIESPWEPRVALFVNFADPGGRCALDVVGAHLRLGFSLTQRPEPSACCTAAARMSAQSSHKE